MGVVTMEITSYLDVSQLIKSGVRDFSKYGRVNVSFYRDELIKLSYSSAAFYEGNWNWLELHSRGHIYNLGTGKLVALPFDKFFNLGECGRYPDPSSEIIDVTEKIDGTLGIGYFWDGKWRISTRGSFDSPQAIWATEFLQKNYPEIAELPSFLTPLFEIVYPENYYLSDLVVNYGDDEELYLIGLRNCVNLADYYFSEVEEIASQFGFETPWVYSFENIDEIMASREILSEHEEGWVIHMSDGSRYKVKGEKYSEISKIVSGFNKRRVFDLFAEDVKKEFSMSRFSSKEYFENIPNEQYPVHEKHAEKCREMLIEFSTRFFEDVSHWHVAYSTVSHIKDRGEFARAVIESFGKDDAHILFALRDGRLDRFYGLLLDRIKLTID